MTPSTPRYCPPFTPMVSVLQPGRQAGWALERFTLTEAEVRHTQAMSAFSFSYGEYRDLQPGSYMRLYKPTGLDRVMMSDTPMERRTNLEFIRQARGRVLVAGLGLGMVLLPLLRKPEVAQVVVLELEPAVIQLVEPQLRHATKAMRAEGRLVVQQADVFAWLGNKQSWSSGGKFDTIYFDIWACPDERAYADSKRLLQLSRRWRAPQAWVGFWRRDEMRRCALG